MFFHKRMCLSSLKYMRYVFSPKVVRFDSSSNVIRCNSSPKVMRCITLNYCISSPKDTTWFINRKNLYAKKETTLWNIVRNRLLYLVFVEISGDELNLNVIILYMSWIFFRTVAIKSFLFNIFSLLWSHLY